MKTTTTTASAMTSRPCPGNPWFICTLWLADYYIARAKTVAELKAALPIFEWTAAHALESGVLAEQVQSVHQCAAERQPAHLVTRHGGQHGDQVSGKPRAASALRQPATSRSIGSRAAARWRCRHKRISTGSTPILKLTTPAKPPARSAISFAKMPLTRRLCSAGDAGHRHARLHRLRSLRRPLRQAGCCA